LHLAVWKRRLLRNNPNFTLCCPYKAHKYHRAMSRGRIVLREARFVRGSADKCLARPTSLCRRTESIVSLERWVCSCAELQGFSCYRGWKEARQATRAILTTWRRELSSSFFPLQEKASKEIHAILTETLEEHAPSYATVKKLGGPV